MSYYKVKIVFDERWESFKEDLKNCYQRYDNKYDTYKCRLPLYKNVLRDLESFLRGCNDDERCMKFIRLKIVEIEKEISDAEEYIENYEQEQEEKEDVEEKKTEIKRRYSQENKSIIEECVNFDKLISILNINKEG